METKETRFLTEGIEIRKNEDGTESREVEGYAAVFDKWSHDLGWFKERINRSAFNDVDMTDVVATFNHNFDNVLARSGSKTLTLSVDSKGLRYSFTAPNTTAGNDLLENIRNGNVKGSSFMFTVKEQKWTDKSGDEIDEREITQIGRLIELGPVTMPAYPDTTAAKRSFEDFKKEQTPSVTVEDLKLKKLNF